MGHPAASTSGGAAADGLLTFGQPAAVRTAHMSGALRVYESEKCFAWGCVGSTLASFRITPLDLVRDNLLP
jgi:hypothetical protein